MKRANKYRAVPAEIVHQGKLVKCASKMEAKHLGDLIWRLRAGEIRDLVFHPRYTLAVNGVKIATYEADAEFMEGGCLVTYEIKGFETPAWKLKEKLFRALYRDRELRVNGERRRDLKRRVAGAGFQ